MNLQRSHPDQIFKIKCAFLNILIKFDLSHRFNLVFKQRLPFFMKKLPLLIVLLLLTLGKTNAQVTPFPTMDSIDINNINALALVHGDMWWNPATGSARTFFPKNSGKTFAFAGSLWISGYDPANNMHIAAQTYRGGNDYWPGPLAANDTLSYASSQNWAKIWKVYKADIDTFLTISTHTTSNTPASILHWPGKDNAYAQGNAGVALAVTSDMAPFVDVNHNGIYEPLSGDYPDIKGDEALWNVYSDNGPAHDQTNGIPLKLEIHLMTYAYIRGTLIDNVVYYEYSIINKSSTYYHACRVGLFADIDLGSGGDDYVGFDSSHRMGIQYNSASPDGVYDSMIPVVGATMILLPGDAPPHHIAPLGNFIYFDNDTTLTGDPVGADHFNDYLHASWRDAVHLSDDFQGPGIATTGRGAGPICNYVYPGDPSDSMQWSECACHNPAGDRRFLPTSADFNFPPGSTQRVALALLVTNLQANYACPLVNFDSIKVLADTAWNNFYAHYDTTLAVPNTTFSNTNIRIFPNPAGNTITVQNPAYQNTTAELYNMLGQKLISQNLQNTNTKMDISHLGSGIYILQLKDENGRSIWQGKIVKE